MTDGQGRLLFPSVAFPRSNFQGVNTQPITNITAASFRDLQGAHRSVGDGVEGGIGEERDIVDRGFMAADVGVTYRSNS